MTEQGRVRIGELSRRVGVSEHLLRAWERRYQLLVPTRSAAGYRLYSAADEERVRRMRRLLDTGLSAAEAAQAARTPGAAPARDLSPTPTDLEQRRHRLAEAVAAMDEPGAQRELDELLLNLTVETALRDVVVPCLHDIGTRWRQGELTVAQEHFASNIIRGRLLALARGWGHSAGRHALLACPPKEQHDLALLVFGVVLSRRGWGVSYLGADTPIISVADALSRVRTDVVVLAATERARFAAVRADLAELAGRTRLLLAGPGADPKLAAELGATVLADDPVTAAETLTR